MRRITGTDDIAFGAPSVRDMCFPAGLAACVVKTHSTEEDELPPKNLSFFTRQFCLDFADHDDYLSEHGSQRRDVSNIEATFSGGAIWCTRHHRQSPSPPACLSHSAGVRLILAKYVPAFTGFQKS